MIDWALDVCFAAVTLAFLITGWRLLRESIYPPQIAIWYDGKDPLSEFLFFGTDRLIQCVRVESGGIVFSPETLPAVHPKTIARVSMLFVLSRYAPRDRYTAKDILPLAQHLKRGEDSMTIRFNEGDKHYRQRFRLTHCPYGVNLYGERPERIRPTRIAHV